MCDNLKTLVVHTFTNVAEEVTRELMPHVPIADCDCTNTIYRAVQSHNQECYDLCIISESFTDVELQAFFSDIKKSPSTQNCVFVQLRESLDSNFKRDSLKDLGFTTVISRKLVHEDIEALRASLSSKLQHFEVKHKIFDVEKALQYILDELNRVAADRKRGVKTKFNTISSDFVEMTTNSNEEVLEKYYEMLLQRSEQNEAPPIGFSKIEVPEAVLNKKLPKLTKDSYTGVSSRVWNKLSKKMGAQDSDSKEELNEVDLLGQDSEIEPE